MFRLNILINTDCKQLWEHFVDLAVHTYHSSYHIIARLQRRLVSRNLITSSPHFGRGMTVGADTNPGSLRNQREAKNRSY